MFGQSTYIFHMQMDNLAYNPSEGLLVANELKLEGKKNPDQILKYAMMLKILREKDFIARDSRFLLLFIGGNSMGSDWAELLSNEKDYCRKSSKGTHKDILQLDVVEIAESASYASTTWHDVISFNESYSGGLDSGSQQVEQKLLSGFNDTLRSKAAMQTSHQVDV